MTRKDYIILVDAIQRGYNSLMYATTNAGETKRASQILRDTIAVALHRDNAKFDSEKFYKACGIPA